MLKQNQFITVVSVFALLSTGLYFFGIRYNCSESLPYKVFIGLKANQSFLNYGSIISFQHEKTPHTLAKAVVGLPGDRIQIIQNHLYINATKIAEIKNSSPSGMKLTPIQEGIIPKGYLLVLGNHNLSFDSRYKEFGLISVEAIQEILWPIF
jgi:conjugal transfer pilin signal peptidase TrbI